MLAQVEARLLNHSFIGTEHILLGLMHEGDGLAAKALERRGMTLEAVRREVEEKIGAVGRIPTESQPFTPRAKGPRTRPSRGSPAQSQLHRHGASPVGRDR